MNDFTEAIQVIPWGIVAPLIVVQLILIVIALIDCLRSDSTNGPKWVWVIVIIAFQIIGPVSYFIFGRKHE